MRPSWRDWEAWSSATTDPYADFHKAIKGESVLSRVSAARESRLVPELEPLLKEYFEQTSSLFGFPDDKHIFTRDQTRDSERSSLDEFLKSNRLQPEVPAWAGKLFKDKKSKKWLPDVDANDAPSEDSVIVGVIDRGVALHHRSQRNLDGKTRILGAWQQIVDQSLASKINNKTRKPPFGLAFLKPDIDRALEAAQLSAPSHAIDADAFNRLVGQADFFRDFGHRELSRSTAHGTHVMDAATGVFCDARSEDDNKFRDLVRPMVVNLPDREIIGLSSRNLSYFVILGLLWIVHTADRYWAKAHQARHAQEGEGHSSRPMGYPIIINLSFAKQAGSRSGEDDISRVVVALNNFRAANDLYPVFVALPSGNDNLERGNGVIRFSSATKKNKTGRKRKHTVEWRIPPEDQSSNYLEIWFESNDLDAPPELTLELTDPNSNQSSVVGLKEGHFTGLGNPGDNKNDFARIYYEVQAPSKSGSGVKLKRYLICVSPTLLHDSATPEAPSGVWKVTLRNTANKQIFCALNVQTDQSDQPGSRRSRLSFLDDPDYNRFHPETGVLLDSYNYPVHIGKGRYPPSWKRKDFDQRLPPYTSKAAYSPAIARRHGTMNSMAQFRTTLEPGDKYSPGVTIAGGYRLSDGKPAPYSSTGLGYRRFNGRLGIGAPTVAYPSDDGYAHTGRLAAGASDGSVRAMQGTSFAVAQLTRRLAQILLDSDNRKDRDFPLRKVVFEEAEELEKPSKRYGRFADPEKVGGGRLDMAPRTRVPRREP